MVLVTGGTGFLGAYIIRELIGKGYAVRAIRRSDKLPSFLPSPVARQVQWVEGDVLDVVSLHEAMEGVDTVIHSAAIVSFLRGERARMYKVNVEGTANVVNMAIDTGIKRFVHISSIAALGRKVDGGQVDEGKKWEESKANTHYAKSKYKSELEVWRGFSEGLNAVILNPSTILGYGEWGSGSSAIFKTVYDEFKWYTTGVNGFVDVEDVARAAVLLMESDINGERFIINGANWPFRKLMDTMADCFGKKKPSREATAPLLSMAWRMEKIKSAFTGRKPLLTKETARVGLSKTYFENSKFLRAFPEFTFTPLEQTIHRACQQYLAARQ